MSATLFFVHVLLAVVLFFVMNWIGRHAVTSAKYYQITYFSRFDDAPAFNVAFRVLAPVVYIIVVGALLYYLGLGEYVRSIWLVVAYQQIGRWGYLLLWGRGLLLRWGTQVAIGAASILLAYAAYRQIISDPRRLLPDFNNLTNELWLVVLVFLYKLVDSVYAPSEGNEAQKVRYLGSRYRELSHRFGQLIAEVTPEREIHALIYAVLIYETFNRPAITRILERTLPRRGRLRSYGPMQVQSKEVISDAQSVRAGAERLRDRYLARRAELKAERTQRFGESVTDDRYWVGELRRQSAEEAAKSYNVRSDYADEVLSIREFLIEKYYPELKSEY